MARKPVRICLAALLYGAIWFTGLALPDVKVPTGLLLSVSPPKRNPDELIYYQHLAKKFPNSPDGRRELGRIYRDLGMFNQAKSELLAALVLAPFDAETHNAFGVLLEQTGDVARAKLEYQKAISLDDTCPYPYTNLARIGLDEGNIEYAARMAEKAIQLKPECPDAYPTYAAASGLRGDIKTAVKALKKAISLDPQEAGWYSDLAVWLARDGKQEEALRCADSAIGLDPSRYEYYTAKANVLMSAHRFEEAIPILLYSKKLDPSTSEPGILLATCYGSMGRYEMATKECATTLRGSVFKNTGSLYNLDAPYVNALVYCIKQRQMYGRVLAVALFIAATALLLGLPIELLRKGTRHIAQSMAGRFRKANTLRPCQQERDSLGAKDVLKTSQGKAATRKKGKAKRGRRNRRIKR